jgi:hypothetical protein
MIKAVIVLLVVCVVLWLFSKRLLKDANAPFGEGETGTRRKDYQEGQSIQKRVREKVMQLAESYEREALAYYLLREANERGIPVASKNALIEKHGQVRARPVLRLADAFGDRTGEWEYVYSEIDAYLQAQGALHEEDLLPEMRLSEFLCERAGKSAPAVMDKFLAEMEKN